MLINKWLLIVIICVIYYVRCKFNIFILWEFVINLGILFKLRSFFENLVCIYIIN